MEIKSRKDEIVLNAATGKYEKTSIITSEMTTEELRNYVQNLIRHAKALDRELVAVCAEVETITHLLGGRGAFIVDGVDKKPEIDKIARKIIGGIDKK